MPLSLSPWGREQPMVQACGVAPPRWDFGLFSPEASGGSALGLALSKPSVIRGQSAADRKAGECASAALGLLPGGRTVRRGRAVPLCSRRGDSLWRWGSVHQCVPELLCFIEG